MSSKNKIWHQALLFLEREHASFMQLRQALIEQSGAPGRPNRLQGAEERTFFPISVFYSSLGVARSLCGRCGLVGDSSEAWGRGSEH